MDLNAPLPELMESAREIRDQAWGNAVTYSPKVFIPLTRLCRDSCSYCTFVKSPAAVDDAYLSREQVLAIAHAGEAAGCTEALFTLGERPEMRYAVAREWLSTRGHSSTIEYLGAMCAAVTAETALIPHANAGALTGAEFRLLRPNSASQGMMLESLNPDLAAHRLAPDKTPERRLSALEAAGNASIPFTTGILVGIGESAEDRIVALQAITKAHERHGHVAEVIVQPFRPKQRTAMRGIPAAPDVDHLRTVALARLILPPDVHLQAPPNLSDDFGALLDAGCDDWGGVSPVTPDHVNPERPWPAVERMAEVAAARGFQLRRRLPIYDEFIHPKWVDPLLLPKLGAAVAEFTST